MATAPRVLFLGDSFTAGTGDPRGIGWVGRVTAHLAERGTPIAAVNRGVPGDTSVGIAQRWDYEVERALGDPPVGRVVLSFGANDAMGFADRTVIAQTRTLAVMEDLLDRAAAAALPALVVGIGAVDDPAHNARSRALELGFADACATRGVPCIAVLDGLLADGTWVREAGAGDGAHPGAAGYDHLTALVLAGGIAEWLVS